MSLVSLLKEANEQERQEFLHLLEISSNELDLSLRRNNEKAEEMALLEKSA